MSLPVLGELQHYREKAFPDLIARLAFLPPRYHLDSPLTTFQREPRRV